MVTTVHKVRKSRTLKCIIKRSDYQNLASFFNVRSFFSTLVQKTRLKMKMMLICTIGNIEINESGRNKMIGVKILEIIVYLITMYLLADGVCGLCERRIIEVSRPLLVIAIITELLGCIVWIVIQNIFVQLAMQILIVYVMFTIIFNENAKSRLFFTIYLTLVHSIIMNMEVVILNLCGIATTDIIAPVSIMLICIPLYYWMKHKLRVRFRDAGLGYGILMLVALGIDCLVILGLGGSLTYPISQTYRFQKVLILIYVAVISSVIFKFILITKLVITRYVFKEKELLAAKYLEDQKEHYDYLRQKEYDTKRFRHDIKGHLLVMQQLLRAGNTNGAEKYLKEISDRIELINGRVSVNNDIADAIINRFIYEAEKNGIQLQIEGHFPNECSISTFDLSTVLSNLLDNAISAELDAGYDLVKMEFRYDDRYIYIDLINHIREIPKIHNGIIASTKSDTDNHGFGMVNIRESVNRNGGDIIISVEGKTIRQLVCLSNN